MRSPANGMRLKNAVLIDINEKAGWLHLSGGAMNSMMAWLNEYHLNEFKEVPADKIKDYDRDVFAILKEPTKRYWDGITEWSTCWGLHEWWQYDDIMIDINVRNCINLNMLTPFRASAKATS